MGDKGDKSAARPPEGSLVETRWLIKGPKSAIVPFPGPRSGPKSRTGPGALAKRAHSVVPSAINRAYYLVVVDNYAKWPKIQTTTVEINFLREIFSRFDIPASFVSDNGRQFTSSEFKFFYKSIQIQHITTPPYHPRSNGQAEPFVDMFKRALKISEREESDEKRLQQFLSVFRITPNSDTRSGMSPVELMFARKTISVFKIITERKTRTSRNIRKNEYLNPGENIHSSREKNFEKSMWLKKGSVD